MAFMVAEGYVHSQRRQDSARTAGHAAGTRGEQEPCADGVAETQHERSHQACEVVYEARYGYWVCDVPRMVCLLYHGLVLCNSINSCCATVSTPAMQQFSTPAMQQFSTPAVQQFSTKPHIHSNTHFFQPNSNHLSPEFCNSTFSYLCHLVKYVFQEVRNVRKATGKGVCSYPFVRIPFGSLGADRLPLCAARPKPWRQERLPCQGTRPSSQRRPLLWVAHFADLMARRRRRKKFKRK